MKDQKEHLTALAIKSATLKHASHISTELAVKVLNVVEEKLVGQVEATDFKATENAIHKLLRQHVERATEQ